MPQRSSNVAHGVDSRGKVHFFCLEVTKETAINFYETCQRNWIMVWVRKKGELNWRLIERNGRCCADSTYYRLRAGKRWCQWTWPYGQIYIRLLSTQATLWRVSSARQEPLRALLSFDHIMLKEPVTRVVAISSNSEIYQNDKSYKMTEVTKEQTLQKPQKKSKK